MSDNDRRRPSVSRPDPRVDPPTSIPPNSIPPLPPASRRKPLTAFVTRDELDEALEKLRQQFVERLPSREFLKKVDDIAKEFEVQKIARDAVEKFKQESRQEEEHRLKVASWTSEIRVNEARQYLPQPAPPPPPVVQPAPAVDTGVHHLPPGFTDAEFKKKQMTWTLVVTVIVALIGLAGAAISSQATRA